MPRKIAWIAFWMTVVYWLGGAFGCAAPGDDQNYEILEDDEPRFETDAPSLQSRLEIADELNVDLAAADAVGSAEVADDEAVSGETAGKVAAAEVADEQTHVTDEATQSGHASPGVEVHGDTSAYAAIEPVVETVSTLDGLDRSNWSVVQAGTSDGRTYHFPIYHQDIDQRRQVTPIKLTRPVRVRPGDGPKTYADVYYDEAQLLAALDGQDAGGLLDFVNLTDLVVQPLKFGADTVLMPAKMVFVIRPNEYVTTPPTPSVGTSPVGDAADHAAAESADDDDNASSEQQETGSEATE